MKDAKTIAYANDLFRTTMIQTPRHKIVMTEGVALSPIREKVIEAVRNFDTFSAGNDPHQEHDFGQVIVDKEKFFFKIDYYDLNYEYGSDPKVDEVARLLTLMRADEY